MTTLKAEVYGAGAGGGASTASEGGGGGGAYAVGSTQAVSNANFVYFVGAGGAAGANGGSSWWVGTTTVFAPGGLIPSLGTNSGAGGTAGIGDLKTAGGAGGAAGGTLGGGGGGGGASLSGVGGPGAAPVGTVGGAGGTAGAGAGAGGHGGNRTLAGTAGVAPGGGGGGGGTVANAGGGTLGQAIFTYTTPLGSSLQEDFSAGTLNALKWNSVTTFGSITFAGGNFNMISPSNNTQYAGMDSLENYDLTSSFYNVQLVSAGDQSLVGLEVFPINWIINGSNTLFWYVNSNQITAFKKINNVQTSVATATYDPNVHKYFQIREAIGTTYYEYSTDGTSYLGFGTLTNPFAITSVLMEFSAGDFSATHVAATVSVDNFNFIPAAGGAAPVSWKNLMGVGQG